MQEAIITDETGSMRLVLWESDISKITSGCTYNLQRALVRNFRDVNYLTFNKNTEVKLSNETFENPDELPPTKDELTSAACPPLGIQFLKDYIICNKCSSRCVPSTDTTKFIKCSNCGMLQLKARCQSTKCISALFLTDELDKKSIFIGNEIIDKIIQNTPIATAVAEDNDNIIEAILSSQGTIYFNASNIAVDFVNK